MYFRYVLFIALYTTTKSVQGLWLVNQLLYIGNNNNDNNKFISARQIYKIRF